ncbi:DUF1854 domain-containing protein [Cerasicoccus arenae]|uniref:DUF1854 domain-containing protein n=1 Tax=Cerasicoccus arenae TaxID=424488 RepID=A0A8J3GDX6_9BACT|nr:DUF1854 domain-containing protein [Cerasicoccus arenae]MBK1857461.1 DUF1854 domain-containing protein [Cerasicoccus arenae]GHB95159.1 hypothetical protein GCM10007047_08510 [Cerasicoccus arenae]
MEASQESPPPLQLASCGAGRLTIWREGADAVIVRPVKCFPLSEPGRYLSLRNDKNEEVGFIASSDDLDESSARALQEAIIASSFTFAVTGIDKIDTDFELRVWKVQTAAGPRQFQTALDAWPRSMDDGGFLMEDVFGDLYRFPPVDQLDRESAKRMWSMVG